MHFFLQIKFENIVDLTRAVVYNFIEYFIYRSAHGELYEK